MKIGVADYGMNVWHGGFYDLETRLKDLKAIGYDGIERLDDAVSSGDALQRASLFRKYGMDFATCRGQTAQNKIQWTAAFGKKYVWLDIASACSKDMSLFCRQAASMGKACAEWNIKAIVHNHLGQTCESQENVETFLDNTPECGLLLDTGHLAAAGGSNLEIVEKYHDRIVAVHVKDYVLMDESVGLDNYQKRGRFCELGAGNINLDNAAILKLLIEKGYDGWVFVEHDRHLQEPLTDLAISREYLREKVGI